MNRSITSELLRLLIVDDDEIDRMSIKRLLAKTPLHLAIEELSSAEDIVEVAKTNAYDCIILDYYLPGETGLEVIARLRDADVSTPILVVADQDEDVGATVVAAGASDFLPKRDMTPARLASRVRYAMLLKRAMHREQRARQALDEQQELYRQVLAAIPNGVVVADLETRQIIMSNAQAELILGEGGAKLFQPDSGLAIDQLMSDASNGTLPIHDSIYRVVVGPLKIDQSQDRRIVITLDDITAEKRARQLAEDAAKSRQEVLAIVSHDLKGPLGSIGIASEAMADESTPPAERQKLLAAIQRSVKRSNRLIRDLLDSAKLESGTLMLAPREVSIASLIDRSLLEYELQAKDADVTLHAFYESEPGSLGDTIYADPDRVMQVLGNLLGNSLKHARSTERIDVIARNAGDNLEIAVRDYGGGIPDSALPHIFERYWQSSRSGGTGLGLQIVRGLMTQHGGSATARNHEEGGAEVLLTFPRRKTSGPT